MTAASAGRNFPMQILILGASSQVGLALTRAFASGNALWLVGRNRARLDEAVQAGIAAGAIRCTALEVDLVTLGTPDAGIAGAGPIDLIVDAASASSAFRDSEIPAASFSGLVLADAASRGSLMAALLSRQPKAPAIIFISTVLARLRSPDRLVYSALKQLLESYYRRLRAERPDLRLMVVTVGTVIDPKRPSEKPVRLAAAVRQAYDDGRSSLFFGGIGKLYLCLFYLQPLVFFAVARLQRALRGAPRKDTGKG